MSTAGSGGLRDDVRRIIVSDIFRPLHNKGEWKVLVVDELAQKIVNSCLKLTELLDNGITLIENIRADDPSGGRKVRGRQPLAYLDAVYFLRPTPDNLEIIRKDFGEARDDYKNRLYKTGHIFFTEMISDEDLTSLAKSDAAPFIKTVKEVNVAFLPIEERVFSLDNRTAYADYFSENPEDIASEEKLDQLAEQLVTVCAVLCDTPCPKVRYCNTTVRSVKHLAERVQKKLDKYSNSDVLTGSNNRSTLIILDRGFDPITPFLHDLFLQAMAYDLLSKPSSGEKIEPESNTFKYENEVILEPENELWKELRHLHISQASSAIQGRTKKLLEKYNSIKNRGAGDKANMADLKAMLNMMPGYKREESNMAAFSELAENCYAAYSGGTVERIVHLEQELATGFDERNEPFDAKMTKCVNVFINSASGDGPLYTPYEKLRILILYLLNKMKMGDPMREDSFARLILKADIKKEEQAVHTIKKMGINIIGDLRTSRTVPPRRGGHTEETFVTSRWVPVVQDIMSSYLIDRNLDPNAYPSVVRDTQASADNDMGVQSLRGAGTRQPAIAATRNTGPKLIIFIMGSLSYAEMRCAHLASRRTNQTRFGAEVIIGSDMILTPEKYIDELVKLQ